MEINPRSSGNEYLPDSWTDALGPLFLKADISELAQSDDGLILLETTDGVEVCPVFQFDINDDGEIIVHPDIANAWELLTALQVEQLGDSKWTTAGRLTAPRPELNGDSWAIALRDPESDDQTKNKVYSSIVRDAIQASRWSGIPLIDPRTALPLQ